MHTYEQIQQSAAVWPALQTAALLNGCADFTAAWVRPGEEREVL